MKYLISMFALGVLFAIATPTTLLAAHQDANTVQLEPGVVWVPDQWIDTGGCDQFLPGHYERRIIACPSHSVVIPQSRTYMYPLRYPQYYGHHYYYSPAPPVRIPHHDYDHGQGHVSPSHSEDHSSQIHHGGNHSFQGHHGGEGH